MNIFNGLIKYVGLLLAIIVVQSCSVKTEGLPVNPDVNEHFFNNGDLPQSAKWWLNFEDKTLNELVTFGLQQNQSLRASLATVKRARASLDKQQASNYPNLYLSSGSNSPINKANSSDTAFLGLTSNWELDLWGRLDALEDKARWDVIAREALYKARANIVVGAISTAWFGWLTEVDKQRLYADQHKRTKAALNVINRRFALGKNSITDIWQQQRLLESITAQQALNNARLAIYESQLALWLGVKTSGMPTLIRAPLPQIPDLPQLGVPLMALQKRPDIQYAFAALQASNASLAAAVSDRFPRVTLRANYSTNKNSAQDLFDDWSGAFLSSLLLPILNSEGKKSIVEQQQHQLTASFAQYKQAWFDAIFAVDKALITEQQLSIVAANFGRQMALAKKTERIVALKYFNGKSSYLTLLKAQETSLSLERQVVDAQFSLINNRISLYRELSHGNFQESQDNTFNPDDQFSEIIIIGEKP